MRTFRVLFFGLALSLAAIAQPAEPPADVLISTGFSMDYTSHQPSGTLSVAPHVATLGGMPTYSVTTFETSLTKAAGQTSNNLTIRTGILQIPWHSKHVGLFVLTDGGILKFDAGTLGTFTGGAGAYIDVVGLATKDRYHGWIAPMLREVSIAGMQVKPVYGIQISTVFSK